MKHLVLYLFLLLSVRPYLSAQNDSLLLQANDSKRPLKIRMDAYAKLLSYYSTRDFDKCLALAEAATKLIQTPADSIYLGPIEQHAGVAYYFKGQYEKAAAYYYSALRYYEKAGDQKNLAFVYNDIAKLYRKTKDLDRSLSFYDKALTIFTQLKDSSGLQMIYNESGVVFEYKGDYDEAIRRYTESMHYAEALNDKQGVSWAQSFIAGVYVIQKKFDPAEQYLKESLKTRESINDSFTIALSHSDLGALYSAKGDLEKARQSFEISNRVAEKMKYPELLSNNYRELSSVASRSGNLTEALDYYKKYTALKDSIFSVEKNKQITELNTKYDTEKKEQQILLQRSELSRKNLAIAAILILVILGIFLAYLAYHRYQLKQKAIIQEAIMHQQEMATRAVIEAEEKERQRIAKDLHDGVGQIMSAAKMNLSSIENEIDFRNQEQRVKFEKIINLVDESCKEVRSVSHNMMPNALLKAGLASAIREFTDKIDGHIIKVDLYSEGLNERLDSNIETVLYRVIQECVNNVIKHSGANHLDIALIRDAEGISATIEDNGKGFDTQAVEQQEGIGLKNIRTRIEYLKGTVEFDSKPGKGTVVALFVPLKDIQPRTPST